jgi:hypothetical protein
MQALRGEKRTRSRYSSPAANASANAAAENSNTVADGPAERPKTMLDLWIEPPLPAPRPSFADHGIERHGVVANMAPLGTRPSSKIMKSATRPEGADVGGRVAVGKRTGASNTIHHAEDLTLPGPTTSSSSLRRRPSHRARRRAHQIRPLRVNPSVRVFLHCHNHLCLQLRLRMLLHLPLQSPT